MYHLVSALIKKADKTMKLLEAKFEIKMLKDILTYLHPHVKLGCTSSMAFFISYTVFSKCEFCIKFIFVLCQKHFDDNLLA